MDTPHGPAITDPPSENESATTQPWEDLTFSSSSSSSTSTKEHNLTAETYNKIFLHGFRDAITTIFPEWGDNFELPPNRKKPPADMSPVEAYRQGYNIAITVFIIEEGGKDREEKWKGWAAKRWKGRL